MSDDLIREAEGWATALECPHNEFDETPNARMLRRLIARAKLADLVIHEGVCLWFMEDHDPKDVCREGDATKPCRICRARMDVEKADGNEPTG